jgi:hypothetical protein
VFFIIVSCVLLIAWLKKSADLKAFRGAKQSNEQIFQENEQLIKKKETLI